MLEMANDFELKDNDCMQCGKEIEPRKFLFIQAIWMDSNKQENEYIVVADTVDVSEMSLSDIECAICGYYDEIKAMEESNQTPLGKLDYLVAECAFESDPYCSWEYKSECVSWDRAEEIIQKFIDTDGTCFEDR